MSTSPDPSPPTPDDLWRPRFKPWMAWALVGLVLVAIVAAILLVDLFAIVVQVFRHLGRGPGP